MREAETATVDLLSTVNQISKSLDSSSLLLSEKWLYNTHIHLATQ